MDDVCFGLVWRFDFEFDAMRVASAGNKDWVSAGCRWTAKIIDPCKVLIRRRWDRYQFCDFGCGFGNNADGRRADWLGNSISKPGIFVGDVDSAIFPCCCDDESIG